MKVKISVFCLCLAALLASFAGRFTETRAYAQSPGQIELACPAGYSPVSIVGQTLDGSTGKWRQVICSDSFGHIFMQPDSVAGAIPSLPINLASQVTGVLPVANGGSPTVFSVDLTAQAANCATQTFTTPAANGFYRLDVWDEITQAATTSSTIPALNLNWTTGDGNVSKSVGVIGASTLNGAGVTPGFANAPQTYIAAPIYAKAGVAITLSCSGYASSGATSMQYAVHARLKGPF